MNEFKTIISNITSVANAQDMENIYAPQITQIVERYLGKGRKVGDMSREQTEALSLIVADLKELSVK